MTRNVKYVIVVESKRFKTIIKIEKMESCFFEVTIKKKAILGSIIIVSIILIFIIKNKNTLNINIIDNNIMNNEFSQTLDSITDEISEKIKSYIENHLGEFGYEIDGAYDFRTSVYYTNILYILNGGNDIGLR